VSGIDPTTITPPDAAVAIRSFPRRWKGVLALAEDEDDGDALLRRGSPSVLDLLRRSVATLRGTDGWLRTIRIEDHPKLTPWATASEGDVDDLVDAAGALARTVEEFPAEGWNRTAVLGDEEVTALDIVRRAVLSVADDLRQAERTLREQVGRA
jgi:hypothetical protein